MNEKQAKAITKKLKNKYRNSKKNGLEILSSFSDVELTAYIAVATLSYGRSWKDSIENAEIHLENKEKAIKLFGTSSSDLLGAY